VTVVVGTMVSAMARARATSLAASRPWNLQTAEPSQLGSEGGEPAGRPMWGHSLASVPATLREN